MINKTMQDEINALAALPDEQIDCTDIAETYAQDWQGAIRNPLYKPVKQSTTVRIDQDVLHWLKSKGKGYQTRMNDILRQAMLKDLS
ncbi:MAG: BrnA antitoxin family protein [Acinetobacter sp.]|nr:BrnA antitoxin family protein [Acinetobacter sp.]